MKIITKTIEAYTYDELNDEAKTKVKQWLLDDDLRNELFYEDVMEYLAAHFPRSDLKVKYSLSYCQGDGLNIYGELNLLDFLEIWQADENDKYTMANYLSKITYKYFFEKAQHYCYSCKFMDARNIDYTIDEFLSALWDNQCNAVWDEEIIRKFFVDMITHFEKLDKQFEKEGYIEYLCEMSEEDARETCEANDYMFDIDGNII